MPTEVILPRVDMDMTEGMIAAWHVSEGDEVREGTLIFEIETSKATMEIDAPASGIIRQISAPVGKTVPVGTAVAWIYASGEPVQEQMPAALSTANEYAAGDTQADFVAGATKPEPATQPLTDETQPLRATPAARRVAREHGLRLASVSGTGPNGRIGEQDVLRAQRGALQSVGDATNATNAANAAAAQRLHAVWLRQKAEAGASTPVVMLHGFAAELNSWRPFSHALNRALDSDTGMLGIDLPMHGKSSRIAVTSMADIVASIDATLSALHVRDFHLVGHSLGGAVALATIAALPRDRVRSLTLLAPAGLGPECNGEFIAGITRASRRASLVPWLKLLFADSSHLDEAFIATAEQQLASDDVRERLAAFAECFFPDGVQSLDLRASLDSIRIPTRVVWGLRDRIIPARHADGLPGRIGVHRFTRAGHLPLVEAQEDVAAIVAENMRGAAWQSAGRRAVTG